MPRGPRFILAGVPHHVISRGNNRQQIFFEDEDIARYRHFLHDALQRFDCDLHAYVVMPNHVHLLLTPASGTALAAMMKAAKQRYTVHVNRRHGRLSVTRDMSGLCTR